MREILVTGATGNVGGLVVERLVAMGRRPRVLVRDPAKASFDGAAKVFVGDLGTPSSLARAMLDVDAVLAVGVGADIEAHDAAIADYLRAARKGRIVKLSSLDAARNEGAVGAWHARSEDRIRAMGIPFVFVRPTGFMSNALAWRHGVRSSTGDGKVAMIDPIDIADVCVAALLRDDLTDQTLPITGPEALGYAEMAAILARVLERPFAYESLSDEEAATMLRALGRPPAVVNAVTSLWRGIREGKVTSEVTDVVTKVLGRPARSFETWARANANAFR